MCVAVDSHMMLAFQRDRVLEQHSIASECLNRILIDSYIALDDSDQCLTEYDQTVSGIIGEEMRAWISQALNDNKLRILPLIDYRETIRRCTQAGLPNNDKRWVKLCCHPCVTHFLTDDIDFYDPGAKMGSQKQKSRAKNERRGRMLNLIQDEARVIIFCPDQLDDFFQSSVQAPSAPPAP